MSEGPSHFGIPGVCYSIDGDWWHEPGSVTFDPAFEEWLRTGDGPMPASTTPVACCGVIS